MSRSSMFNRIFIEHTQCVKHDGASYQLDIANLPAMQDAATNEIFFDEASDAAISDALRHHIGLLSPSAIAQHRGDLDLTQKQLAEYIGIASETISRWESGSVIQSRSSDRLLRLFFFVPQARSFLGHAPQTPSGVQGQRLVYPWSQAASSSWKSLNNPSTRDSNRPPTFRLVG